ncbi:hypothetical protein HHI36_005074 [Cryptolaemus montrouzieri]|uniref:SRCR domain-containing protein n=1 Tax=Cryptolaemus montrouzieri TaxID=559131 RepID=A0ABD2NTB8_9CUCU
MAGYGWEYCEDFDVPENSIRCGSDDDGSVIFCGKAWYDGNEVPAKIVPNKKECRVKCSSGERIVPHCSKVLVCRQSSDAESCGSRRKHHHHQHRRHHDCRRRCEENCSDSCSDQEEETVTTKTESSNNNECKTFVKTVRVRSSSTTTTVKKEKKKRKSVPQCWTEQRTRMVPKVTYQRKVRYEPKVHVEKQVRYVPETYETTVCGRRSCCKPCRSERRESCREEICDDCCSENEICNKANIFEGEEIIVKPKKCPSPPISPRICS